MPTAEPSDGSRAGNLQRADDLRLVVRCTDLTTLEGDDTPGRIRALCSQALRPDPADPTVGPVAAVCVYPALAPLAAELLAGTPVAVASVAGAFPSGLSPLEVRVAEVRAAVAAGAQEIDTVLNRSAFLSGRSDIASAELGALKEAAGGAHFKVILEVCELGSGGAIAEATRLAIGAGADMVKTSTGKGAAGASPEAVLAMAQTVAEHCAAGGRPGGPEDRRGCAHRRRGHRVRRHRALRAGRGLANAKPPPLRRLQPAEQRGRFAGRLLRRPGWGIIRRGGRCE